MIAKRVTPKIQSGSAFRSLLLTLSLFVCIVSGLLFHSEAFGAQVTLAWDPETASGLAGYKVHYGTVSKNYPLAVDAENQTTTTITNGATRLFSWLWSNRSRWTDAKVQHEAGLRSCLPRDVNESRGQAVRSEKCV